MTEDIVTSMSLPLDGDGFLRRECPTCEREFKWLVTDETETAAIPDGGYYCPYCAVQAGSDSWFTKAQRELAEGTLAHEVLGPRMDELLGGLAGDSGSLSVKVSRTSKPDPPTPLQEPEDMRRVDFGCHPEEPAKVSKDWSRRVHCMICATPA
jgi:hypothetical protein